MGVGERQRVLQPGAGDTVAAAAGDAFDESVGAQAPQVACHLAGGDVLVDMPPKTMVEACTAAIDVRSTAQTTRSDPAAHRYPQGR